MSVEWRSPSQLKELVKQDRPMKVLIMGMPRSGTMSLVAALKKLGYTPYDFIDRIILGHLPRWTDALRAKFLGQGKPWGKPEFDRLLKGFDVRLSPTFPLQSLITLTLQLMRAISTNADFGQCVLDVPCPFFTEEFLSAYPSSLVILNKRDPDAWLASMNSTLFHVFSWSSWPLLARLDPGFAGTWYTHCTLTWEIFCGNDYGEKCKEKYLEHYDYVRRVTPKDRLLEYEVKEGWEPLCKFLGKEVPEGEDFPNVNDKGSFVEGHGKLWAYGVFNAVKNISIGLTSVAVGVAAWWWYRA
ncbi:MAG: hypothetical protein Q9186_005369 [Xanthomendoza sp. 1 TL-2023]